MTVKAVYTPKTYVTHYDLGECANATITAKTQEVKFDSNFTLFVPHLETIVDYDYQFIKWVIKDTEEEFKSGIYTYVGDLYLVAVWHKYTPDF